VLRKLTERLFAARMRVLADSCFFGMLLLQLRFAADTEVETAATDGIRLYFNPDFVAGLSDDALDFLLYHEVMHLALRHAVRGRSADAGRFDEAADIVVNSNILRARGLSAPPFIDGAALPYKAPDGSEGWLHTAESLCALLAAADGDGDDDGDGDGEDDEGDGNGDGDGDGDGKGDGDGDGDDEDDGDGDGDGDDEGDDEGDGKGDGKGDGDGDGMGSGSGSGRNGGRSNRRNDRIDSHERWGQGDSAAFLNDKWTRAVKNAAEAAVNYGGAGIGFEGEMLRRLLGTLKPPQTDWRELLNNFVQEEITDYSFEPPDRRFGDGDFFLPDFNAPSDTVRDLLFAVDTSGSISDAALTAAFSEIKGAIDQFDGRLAGKLCFFECGVTEPVDFESVDELLAVKPHGGGGTNVNAVFECAAQRFEPDELTSIIILTDGECRYPTESAANGVPVLWLINNERHTPPWGKVARIRAE
ncbi:MAG: hypothetical protein DBY36_06210, partial [Clostridiales bacterium]